jgi:hypothetical protein
VRKIVTFLELRKPTNSENLSLFSQTSLKNFFAAPRTSSEHGGWPRFTDPVIQPTISASIKRTQNCSRSTTELYVWMFDVVFDCSSWNPILDSRRSLSHSFSHYLNCLKHSKNYKFSFKKIKNNKFYLHLTKN